MRRTAANSSGTEAVPISASGSISPVAGSSRAPSRSRPAATGRPAACRSRRCRRAPARRRRSCATTAPCSARRRRRRGSSGEPLEVGQPQRARQQRDRRQRRPRQRPGAPRRGARRRRAGGCRGCSWVACSSIEEGPVRRLAGAARASPPPASARAARGPWRGRSPSARRRPPSSSSIAQRSGAPGRVSEAAPFRAMQPALSPIAGSPELGARQAHARGGQRGQLGALVLDRPRAWPPSWISVGATQPTAGWRKVPRAGQLQHRQAMALGERAHLLERSRPACTQPAGRKLRWSRSRERVARAGRRRGTGRRSRRRA